MKLKIISLVSSIIVLTACDHKVSEKFSGVEGVWQIYDIRSKNSSDSTTNKIPASLFIFAPHHYSMTWDINKNSHNTFAEHWNPTDTEKIERYNSFVINSGTYEITDSNITMYPIVARVPEFMGGMLLCEYRISEDTLFLQMVDEYSFDGIQAPWVANDNGLLITLLRIEPIAKESRASK